MLTEASHLLQRDKRATQALLGLLERDVLGIRLGVTEEHSAVRALMRRYADLPMSLADACLVRMTELARDAPVLTLDGDFRIYRRLGRQSIPLITPLDG